MKKKVCKRCPVSAICSALGTILLVLLILLCIPLIIPRWMGYEIYTVISGSMEPEIPVGSLVLIGHMEASEVSPDDVIAFYGGHDSSAIVTHRVIENRVVMGEFITKGDANKGNDMNPVDYDEFIGRVELSLPYLGMIAQRFTTLKGKITAGCVIGAALLLYALSSVFDRRDYKR